MIAAREQHLSQPSKLFQYFRTLKKVAKKMTELRYLRILRFPTAKYNKHLEKTVCKSYWGTLETSFCSWGFLSPGLTHSCSRYFFPPPFPCCSLFRSTSHPFFSLFCSTHPPLPSITPFRLLPLYRRQQKQNCPPSNYWTFSHTSITPMILSASTHTQEVCVCLPPLCCTLLHFPLWPLLPLFGSAPLFLSSLCRWRSRWLARVRELSTLIFYLICHFHHPPLSLLSPLLSAAPHPFIPQGK